MCSILLLLNIIYSSLILIKRQYIKVVYTARKNYKTICKITEICIIRKDFCYLYTYDYCLLQDMIFHGELSFKSLVLDFSNRYLQNINYIYRNSFVAECISSGSLWLRQVDRKWWHLKRSIGSILCMDKFFFIFFGF